MAWQGGANQTGTGANRLAKKKSGLVADDGALPTDEGFTDLKLFGFVSIDQKEGNK